MKPIQLIGIFLLGLIAGLIVGMLLMGRKVDDLTLENQLLLGHAQDLEARLKRLESLEKKGHIIQSVKVVATCPDEQARLKGQETIQGLLQELVGRDVDAIDPPLLETMVHQRPVAIQDETYLVYLTASHISKTVTIYINLVPQGQR
ncbi:MAG: hypothetical protein ACOX20_12125 [Limnochordia bacterium]|jgi:hypothetical protein